MPGGEADDFRGDCSASGDSNTASLTEAADLKVPHSNSRRGSDASTSNGPDEAHKPVKKQKAGKKKRVEGGEENDNDKRILRVFQAQARQSLAAAAF